MSRRPFPPPDVPYHRPPNEWGRRGPAEYRPFRHPEEYEAYLSSERERQWNVGQNQHVGGGGGGGGPSRTLSQTQNDLWDWEREGDRNEGRKWNRGPDLYRPGPGPGPDLREDTYRPGGYDSYRPGDEPSPSRFQHAHPRAPNHWAPPPSTTWIPPSLPLRSPAPHRRDVHSHSHLRSAQSSAGPSRDISREGSAEPSAYVPPQRRSGTSSAPIPEQFGSPQPPFRRASRSPSPFIPTLPPAEYIALSRNSGKHLPSTESGGAGHQPLGPKLLVLDLNGALVYRNKQTGTKRKSYPRPYLSCFLEYLFLSEPTSLSATSAPARPYEVFVWSSAQPHNVRAMVESTFGSRWIEGVWEKEGDEVKEQRLQRGEGRLTGVWARDRMGLNAHEYGNKVQTFKDLRKVAEHFQPTVADPNSEPEGVDRSSTYSFDESNIILLDDSPLKAIFQPWNQIVIPEFERTAFQSSREAALRLQAKPEATHDGMDEILLAVIGILEDLRGVNNVPAWVRAGGLTLLNSPSPRIGASSAQEPASTTVDAEPTLESLPSHETFDHWFADPNVLRHWIDRGKAALKRKGINLDIGLDTSDVSPGPHQLSRQLLPLSSEGTPQPSGEDLDELGEISGRHRRQSSRYSPTAPASRYSPSAPVDGSAGQDDPVDSSEWLLPPLTEPASGAGAPTSQTSEKNSKRQQQSESQSQSKPNPKSDRPGPGPLLVDSWRTFRAVDVSLYLQDAASRLCPPHDISPLTSQQRESLLGAAKALRELAPDAIPGPNRRQPSMADPARSDLASMSTRPFEHPSEERMLSIGRRVANERNGEAWRKGVLGSNASISTKPGRKAARLDKKERRREAKQRDAMAKGTATTPAQRTRGSGQTQALPQAQSRPSGSGTSNDAAPRSAKRPRGTPDATADTTVPKKKQKGKAAAAATAASATTKAKGGTSILEPTSNVAQGMVSLGDAAPVAAFTSSESQANPDYMSEFVEMLLPPPPPPSAGSITRASHPSLRARLPTTTTAPPTHAAIAAASGPSEAPGTTGNTGTTGPAPGQKKKNAKLHINDIHTRYLAGGGTMPLVSFQKAYQRITSWDREMRNMENTIAEGSRRLGEAGDRNGKGNGNRNGSGSGDGDGEDLGQTRAVVVRAEGKRESLRSKLEVLRKKVGGTLSLPLPQ